MMAVTVIGRICCQPITAEAIAQAQKRPYIRRLGRQLLVCSEIESRMPQHTPIDCLAFTVLRTYEQRGVLFTLHQQIDRAQDALGRQKDQRGPQTPPVQQEAAISKAVVDLTDDQEEYVRSAQADLLVPVQAKRC